MRLTIQHKKMSWWHNTGSTPHDDE